MAIQAHLTVKRYIALVTITAGTPIRIAGQPLKASKVLIQMLHGGSGMGFVYDDVLPGALDADIAATGDPVELAAATADGPGGTYEDAGDVDLSLIAVDGSHTGDTVLVNARLRI